MMNMDRNWIMNYYECLNCNMSFKGYFYMESMALSRNRDHTPYKQLERKVRNYKFWELRDFCRKHWDKVMYGVHPSPLTGNELSCYYKYNWPSA
jgi:hypothetical protein